MGPVKRSKFSEEHVAYALRQAESGTAVRDVCLQSGHQRVDVLCIASQRMRPKLISVAGHIVVLVDTIGCA